MCCRSPRSASARSPAGGSTTTALNRSSTRAHPASARPLRASADHPFGQDRIGKDYFALTMRGIQNSILVMIVIGLVRHGHRRRRRCPRGLLPRLGRLGPHAHHRRLHRHPRTRDRPVVGKSAGRTSAHSCLAAPPRTRVLDGHRPSGAREFLSLREREFVEAARVAGASDMRIIFRHILPNAIGVIIVVGDVARRLGDPARDSPELPRLRHQVARLVARSAHQPATSRRSDAALAVLVARDFHRDAGAVCQLRRRRPPRRVRPAVQAVQPRDGRPASRGEDPEVSDIAGHHVMATASTGSSPARAKSASSDSTEQHGSRDSQGDRPPSAAASHRRDGRCRPGRVPCAPFAEVLPVVRGPGRGAPESVDSRSPGRTVPPMSPRGLLRVPFSRRCAMAAPMRPGAGAAQAARRGRRDEASARIECHVDQRRPRDVIRRTTLVTGDAVGIDLEWGRHRAIQSSGTAAAVGISAGRGLGVVDSRSRRRTGAAPRAPWPARG